MFQRLVSILKTLQSKTFIDNYNFIITNSKIYLLYLLSNTFIREQIYNLANLCTVFANAKTELCYCQNSRKNK